MVSVGTEAMTVAGQLRILVEYGTTVSGEKPNVEHLLQVTGLSRQAFYDLLNGKTTDPRLATLRAICEAFGVSLEYFDCRSAADCVQFLATHERLASDDMAEITHITRSLSERGLTHILRLFEVVNQGMRGKDEE